MTIRFPNTSSRSYANTSARLNKRITLHLRTDGAFNPRGVTTKTYRDVVVWAEVRQQVGFERRLDGVLDRETKIEIIWIRYRDDVSANDELTYNGRRLTISDVAEVGNKHMLKIRAQLGQV